MLEPQYATITHTTQNGFVTGRNFLNNIMDLDSAGRIYSMIFQSLCSAPSNPSNIPILGAFDFETAFPSVIHAWIWLVLTVRKLPPDYIRLFKGIYHNASAVFHHGSQKITIIKFLSGVLQGCPGSAFLFNNALDPFLILFHATLREGNRGIIRACADDIGTVLARLKHLGLLVPIFARAKTLAGLNLKPPKCTLVPLCKFSDEVASDISRWIKKHIPQWGCFAVQDSTKLLGFFLGPGAGKKHWTEQISKIKLRVQCIQTSKASVKLNTHTYNSRVVPVVSYVAQLLPCPRKMDQVERAAMHTCLRLPQNALCHSDFFHLQHVGGPKIRSIVAACASAIFRTARRTLTSWPTWIKQLEVAAAEHLPLSPYAADKLSTECWDSPPIACNLREAFRGFPKDDRWCEGASHAISIIQRSTAKSSASIQVQKICYDALIQYRFVDSLHHTIEKRLNDSFSPWTVDCTNHVSLSECFGTLKGCKVSVAIRVLKCWSNSWATSHRYHEDKILPCLLGCTGCLDSLDHYLSCPHLFALWSFLIEGTSEDPLTRWALLKPSKAQFEIVACIFSSYHAIRNDLRSNPVFLEHNLRTLPSPLLRRARSVFADSFKVEARELAVQHRQFSLPEFLISIS